MPKYMLLLLHRKPGGYEELSPDEIRQIVGRLQAWVEKMRAEGRYVVSDKLQQEGGRVVSLLHGRVSDVDGPYAESKEVIGGYFTLRAASYDEADELVRECPFLEHGRIAIRETDPMGCGDE